MFGYIAAYYRHTMSLYLNVDSDDGDGSDGSDGCDNIPNTDDDYLFNASSSEEDMPRQLAPPLFSYC
jgi:hypothetical protein